MAIFFFFFFFFLSLFSSEGSGLNGEKHTFEMPFPPTQCFNSDRACSFGTHSKRYIKNSKIPRPVVDLWVTMTLESVSMVRTIVELNTAHPRFK